MGQDDELESLIDEMIQAGEEVPDEVETSLLEADEEVTDRLIEVVTDPELARLDAPGDGWGPSHAARLLAKRDDQEAIDPLTKLIADPDTDHYLSDAVIDALGAFGDDIVDPLLDRADEASEPEPRTRLLEAAASTGTDADRVFEALVELLDEQPAEGARILGEFGDERAVEPLQELLDEVSIESSKNFLANEEILETAEAIEELDGDFTRKQRRKVAYARKKYRKAGDRLQRRLKEQGR